MEKDTECGNQGRARRKLLFVSFVVVVVGVPIYIFCDKKDIGYLISVSPSVGSQYVKQT